MTRRKYSAEYACVGSDLANKRTILLILNIMLARVEHDMMADLPISHANLPAIKQNYVAFESA